RLYTQQSVWGVDQAMKIVRIDIDPEEHDRFRRPDCAITADAAAALRALEQALPTRTRPSREAELQAHRAWFEAQMARLEPQRGFLQAMRAALPEDGILVDEVTQMGFAARLAFPATRPRSFFSG